MIICSVLESIIISHYCNEAVLAHLLNRSYILNDVDEMKGGVCFWNTKMSASRKWADFRDHTNSSFSQSHRTASWWPCKLPVIPVERTFLKRFRQREFGTSIFGNASACFRKKKKERFQLDSMTTDRLLPFRHRWQIAPSLSRLLPLPPKKNMSLRKVRPFSPSLLEGQQNKTHSRNLNLKFWNKRERTEMKLRRKNILMRKFNLGIGLWDIHRSFRYRNICGAKKVWWNEQTKQRKSS